jgi:hypothetical protein
MLADVESRGKGLGIIRLSDNGKRMEFLKYQKINITKRGDDGRLAKMAG